MSRYQETFGATHNEGPRHGGGDSWGQGPETYGATHNEPGRRSGRGQFGGGGGDYVPSTGTSGQPSWNGQQPNGHAGTYGTPGNEPPRHQDYGHAGTYGTPGNEPPRHQDYGNGGCHPNTYGPGGNEPPRHRDASTTIYVKNPGNGGSSSMHVNLDTMTQSELVQNISRDLGMNSGQLFVNFQGKPLSGSGSLRAAGLYCGCTVVANGRLRGG